jgi:hypothetical protein
MELRERIAELEVQVTSYRAELTPPPQAARVYSAERHILLVPGADGYELLERKGPAPEAGDTVRLSGPREFRVVRVGPAPFPGALEACAFLEAVPSADGGA